MQPQKILIITSDATMPKWRSKRAKLTAMTDTINEMDNAELTVEVEHQALTPTVVNGYITHEWMDSISGPAKARGYAFVLFHMSDAQHKKWGVKPSLRGLAQDDTDTIGEAYFWADEKTLRNGFNQFVEVFWHEFRHLIFNGLPQEDDTHELHAKNGTLKDSFKGIDYAEHNAKRKNQLTQISLLNQAIPLLLKLIGLKKRKTLYGVAVSYLGRDASPADTTSDVTGCAESVSMVIRDVLPDFPIILGTWTLNERLKADPRFRPVTVPMPGTVIVSPTGTSTSKKVTNGHTGIIGGGDAIMSNDSNTGHFDQNYTLASWNERWGKAGYQTSMYQLIQ